MKHLWWIVGGVVLLLVLWYIYDQLAKALPAEALQASNAAITGDLYNGGTPTAGTINDLVASGTGAGASKFGATIAAKLLTANLTNIIANADSGYIGTKGVTLKGAAGGGGGGLTISSIESDAAQATSAIGAIASFL